MQYLLFGLPPPAPHFPSLLPLPLVEGCSSCRQSCAEHVNILHYNGIIISMSSTSLISLSPSSTFSFAFLVFTSSFSILQNTRGIISMETFHFQLVLPVSWYPSPVPQQLLLHTHHTHTHHTHTHQPHPPHSLQIFGISDGPHV